MVCGTLALDIDGTITDEAHRLPDEVSLFFHALYESGWRFIFLTGREFVYAMDALSKLNFPFYLAVQNGADLLKMPEHTHLKSVYFSDKTLQEVAKIFHAKNSEFLLYAGYEQGDFCYYRPHHFGEEFQEYLELMQRRSATPWQSVEDFHLSSQREFPMIKAIGLRKNFLEIEAQLLTDKQLHSVVISDPKNSGYHYLLITARKASKKEALSYFLQEYALPRPLIVAGDDYNDVEALQLADVRIVMASAPAAVKREADVIAPASCEHGIIAGVNAALEKLRQSGYQRTWA